MPHIARRSDARHPCAPRDARQSGDSTLDGVGRIVLRAVVRDQALVEIEDSLASPSDQIPYDRWGVRSYLGVPVFIGDVCVGTLCALDPQPRRYEPALRPRLVEWGARASARLAELARRPSLRRGGVQHVLRPSFAEIGNSLTPVFGQLGDARTTLDALIADRDDRGGESRASAHGGSNGGAGVRADPLDARRRYSWCCSAPNAIAISELARTSDELARHHTKLVGGVRWEVPTLEVILEVSHCTAVTVVASALSLLAMDMNRGAADNGIHAGIFHRHRRAEMILAAELRTHSSRRVPRASAISVNREEIDVSADPGGIRILLPAA